MAKWGANCIAHNTQTVAATLHSGVKLASKFIAASLTVEQAV